jgi:hypothetical protein
MEGFPEADVLASGSGRRRVMRWSARVAEAVLARAAAGATLRGLCREPGMPAFGTVQQWMRKRAAFAKAMQAARVASGQPLRGRRTTYCVETAEAIVARLCAGEGIAAICRDPTMPPYSTVHGWLRADGEFADACVMAREYQAEAAFERGLEICEGVTPKTAVAARVQLAHLRWTAGKLLPRKYGLVKPVHAEGEEPDDPAEAAPKKLEIVVSHFAVAPDGVVFAIPPRDADDERRFLETYGRVYNYRLD